MITGVDHVMVCVRDLDEALATYRDYLGFSAHAGGEHPGRGTHNAVALFDRDYLELLAVRDPVAVEADGNRGLLEFLELAEGLRLLILGSDDLDADVRAIRERGAAVQDPREGTRRTGDGRLLRWRYAYPGAENPLPVFLIQHLTPLDERRSQVPAANGHRNGARGIERVVVAVRDLDAALATYRQVLGIAASPVIDEPLLVARTASFPVGDGLLTLATPSGAYGPVEEFLEHREGPFLLGLKTESLERTEDWLVDQDITIEAEGAFADGREALLIRPEASHGAWLAWVQA